MESETGDKPAPQPATLAYARAAPGASAGSGVVAWLAVGTAGASVVLLVLLVVVGAGSPIGAMLLQTMAVLSVVLGIVALKSEAAVHRKRAIAAIIVGGSVTALILSAFLFPPSLSRASEKSNRVKCRSNLREIGVAIRAYADANVGRLPDGFDTLLAEGRIEAETFICPSSQGERPPRGTTREVVEKFAATRSTARSFMPARASRPARRDRTTCWPTSR